MFEALNLSCVRDERTLFSGLSFTVEPAEMVQIEGRNNFPELLGVRMKLFYVLGFH